MRLADASPLGDRDAVAAIARLKGDAERLFHERTLKLEDLGRAATRPATLHTQKAWGAEPGEPLQEFPRALMRTLLQLGVSQQDAERLINNRKANQFGKGEGTQSTTKSEETKTGKRKT